MSAASAPRSFRPSYTGPCTPAGAPHHYTFTLIATDLDSKALPPGLTRNELIKALDGHAKVRDRIDRHLLEAVTYQAVVPANAGTHNRRPGVSRER